MEHWQQVTPPGTATTSEEDVTINNFFLRNNFSLDLRRRCDAFARSRFPNARVLPARHQGYCSYTVTASTHHILQFRPESYKLDVRISHEANHVFGDLVPHVSCVGAIDDDSTTRIDVYSQTVVRGIPLSTFRMGMSYASQREAKACHRRLVKDLADVFALSYRHRRSCRDVQLSKGRVGSSLKYRANILESLQDEKLLKHAVNPVRCRLESLEAGTPWVLTHGDLVPTNIMVDPQTGHLTGLVDWGEGEWLPFGVGLYGLEEVLGEEHTGKFEYFMDHVELRHAFWERFANSAHLPLRDILSKRLVSDMRLCRKLGILLWRGIAFDNGRIDRVVDEERDVSEMYKLRMFLGAPEPLEHFGMRQRARLVFRRMYEAFAATVRGFYFKKRQ